MTNMAGTPNLSQAHTHALTQSQLWTDACDKNKVR